MKRQHALKTQAESSGILLVMVSFLFTLFVSCEEKIAETKNTITVTESVSLPRSGGHTVITVSSNGMWKAECNADWINISPTQGYMNGEVTVEVTPCKDVISRKAIVKFSGENTEPTKTEVIQMNDKYSRIDESGPANSFIISPLKSDDCTIYAFSASCKGNDPSSQIVDAKSAHVIWQSCKNLITDIEYNPNNSLVCFSIGAETGNAVVAVKGKNGKIQWSWHLWICDFIPEQSVLTTPANKNGTTWTFMDRNLGALSSVCGDIGSLGLIYQWGRKDPFPGVGDFEGKEPATFDIRGNMLPAPGETASNYGTQELAIQNPDMFYKISYRTNDWTDPSNDDYWGGISRVKSIYDPCPAGWKVPICDEKGASPYEFIYANSLKYDKIHEGYSYNDFWFPCAGTRVYESGNLSFIILSRYGGMWIGSAGKATNTPEYPQLYGQYLFVIEGSMCNTMKDSRSQGMSVRCVKE